MIKRFFAIALILLSLSATAMATVGDWKIYTSYNNATRCQVMGNKVYVLASGALFSYDKEDGEVYTHDKLNSLNDFNICEIAYCKAINALLIIYQNANIDILYPDGEIYNISDFKSKVLASKKINGVYVNGSEAYINTSFGVVILNLERLEFTNTYNININTLCSYVKDNILYIGTDEGLYKGSIRDNLLDKNNFEKINSSKYVALNEVNGNLIGAVDKKGLYTINTQNNATNKIISSTEPFKYLYQKNGKLYCGLEKSFFVINSTTDYKKFDTAEESTYLEADGNTLWHCKGSSGVVECRIKDDKLTDGENYIAPRSPMNNHCEYMTFTSDGNLLVAGGTLNYFGSTLYPGTLMEYNPGDDKWTNYPGDEIAEKTGVRYVNVCAVDEDPKEKGHYFACSFGQGVYEFRNGELVAHYNHNNSALESAVPTSSNIQNYVRVSRVKFDNDGNLWMTNTTNIDNIVKVRKSNGEWLSLNYDKIAGYETMVDILIDSRGWLWVTSLQGGENAGIFCAKTNNTPFDTKDDQTALWKHQFTNQDGIKYTIYNVGCIKEDASGKMWIGTDNGLFVIENPKRFFDDGVFTQIKVPRNDGTNLADYLLSGAYITAITTDGADRKWIGTKTNGIYLISADGLEMIHHFTTADSPLPSNEITSVAVNGESGEVFIGTKDGIVSFMGDATEPEEKLDESIIHVYPNPVRASYSGNISIVGLTLDCEVKIVDTAGYLIADGVSTGGQFTWNGRNAKGEKVSSGVYYVLTYDENGSEGVAAKILITR